MKELRWVPDETLVFQGFSEYLFTVPTSSKSRKNPVKSEQSLTALKLRVYPTQAQTAVLRGWLGARRWVYNTGLYWHHQERPAWFAEREKRRASIQEEQKNHPVVDAEFSVCMGDCVYPSPIAFSHILTLWKNWSPGPGKTPTAYAVPCLMKNRDGVWEERDVSWLSSVPRTAVTQALRDLEDAFRRTKSGQNDSPTYQKNTTKNPDSTTTQGSCRIQLDARTVGWTSAWDAGLLQIPGIMGTLRFRDERKLPAEKPKQLTLSCDAAGRWFVSFVVVIGEAEANAKLWPMPVVFTPVGLDQNLADDARLADSDGVNVRRVRYEKKYANRVKLLNRRLARKTKGSNRWHRCRRKLARAYARARDCRKDFVEQESTALIRRISLLALEDLYVKGMMQNRRMAKSMADAGFGMMDSALVRKCLTHGRAVLRCDRFDASSKTCSVCDEVNEDMTLETRTWVCSGCGTKHDRNTNAAKNILRWAVDPVAATATRKARRQKRSGTGPGRSLANVEGPACKGSDGGAPGAPPLSVSSGLAFQP